MFVSSQQGQSLLQALNVSSIGTHQYIIQSLCKKDVDYDI